MLLTPHAQRERGKVIGIGVHIYKMFIYVRGQKKLNRTLAIDSPPYQKFVIGLLMKVTD